MANGEGCECYARCKGDCICDGVDWRSDREVELEKQVATLTAENGELKKELAERIELHMELVMSVESVHKGETRHQTALRYITEAEHRGDGSVGCEEALKQSDKAKGKE